MYTSTFEDTMKFYADIDFSRLEEKLIQTGRTLFFEKGTTLLPRPNEILVVMKGRLSVLSSDDKECAALGQTFHLTPIGLLERHHPTFRLNYRADELVTVIQLSTEEFDHVFFQDPNNIVFFNQIMVQMVIRLIEMHFDRNNDSGYGTVRRMLLRYHTLTKTHNPSCEDVIPFILQRTKLSRSYVYKITKSLQEGGYITLSNGRLISINRKIPESY